MAWWLQHLGSLLLFLLLTGTALAQDLTVQELLDGMRQEIRTLGERGAAKREFQDFRKRHNLRKLDYWTYLKNKIAFECSRDAGLWHIAYQITDREPNSSNIWKQWKSPPSQLSHPSAYAECDEVSALYAVLARELGVSGVGLFWPTGNHTVAVWKLEGERIVVPTTPIFLERHDGFDAQGFDPETQAVIYDYTARDVSPRHVIPQRSARFFLSQIREYGGASQELLHELRYLREAVWLGRSTRGEFSKLQQRFPDREDQRALKAFSRQFRRVMRR